MDNIVIVGAMANNFIKYKKYNIGKSIFEKNTENLIEDILKKADEKKCQIIIPSDAIVSKDYNSKGNTICIN